MVPQLLPESLPESGIFCRQFCHDIPGSGQRFFRRFHAFFRVHIGLGSSQGIPLLFPLKEERRSQRFQSFFPSLLGAGPPLLFIGQVIIFQFCEFFCSFDSLAQFRGQFPLFVDFGQDLFLALHQIPESPQPFFDGPDLFIQEGPRHLLPVAGDEGNRIPSIQQFHGLFHLPGLDRKFPGNGRGDVSLFHIIVLS